MREQELSKCNGIIARRAEALMAKIQPAPEKRHDQEVELLPGWFLGGATACQS
jgi:hypothetical protein